MSARRNTVTSRRRSSGSTTKLLGAVKLQSPLGALGSDAGSPCSTASEASALTPQDRSPLVVGRAAATAPAAAAAADALAQFGHHLASSRSSDWWLEERLTSSDGPGGSRRHAPSTSPHSGVVEPAASQIVHKALRFITGDLTPPPAEGPPPRKAASSASAAFDSQSILDKGMDAISGVGKLMEGFALTLDNVIGQAFEDWGPPSGGKCKPARRPTASSGSPLQARPQRAARPAPPSQPESWQDFSAPGKENAGVAVQPAAATKAPAAAGASSSGRQPHITSFMSKLDAASEQEVAEWRKRAAQLAGELQRMQAQQEEYQRLRQQYEQLQADAQRAASQASRLAHENSQLKSRGGVPADADPALADPVAVQQVARQMEALLSEKSKLVAENDRLLRENTGLQELLEFTLVHQAQLAGDDELFGEEGYVEEAAAAAHGREPLGGHAAAAGGGDCEGSGTTPPVAAA